MRLWIVFAPATRTNATCAEYSDLLSATTSRVTCHSWRTSLDSTTCKALLLLRSLIMVIMVIMDIMESTTSKALLLLQMSCLSTSHLQGCITSQGLAGSTDCWHFIYACEVLASFKPFTAWLFSEVELHLLSSNTTCRSPKRCNLSITRLMAPLDEWVDTADDRSFTLLGDAFRWDPGGGRGALAERDLSDRQTCSTDQREESQGRGLQLQLPSWKSKVKDPNYMINQHFWFTSISDLTTSNSRNNIKVCQLLSLCGQSLNPFSFRCLLRNGVIIIVREGWFDQALSKFLHCQNIPIFWPIWAWQFVKNSPKNTPSMCRIRQCAKIVVWGEGGLGHF